MTVNPLFDAEYHAKLEVKYNELWAMYEITKDEAIGAQIDALYFEMTQVPTHLVERNADMEAYWDGEMDPADLPLGAMYR